MKAIESLDQASIQITSEFRCTELELHEFTDIAARFR
jgi:hypothetical protein